MSSFLVTALAGPVDPLTQEATESQDPARRFVSNLLRMRTQNRSIRRIAGDAPDLAILLLLLSSGIDSDLARGRNEKTRHHGRNYPNKSQQRSSRTVALEALADGDHNESKLQIPAALSLPLPRPNEPRCFRQSAVLNGKWPNKEDSQVLSWLRLIAAHELG